MDFFLIYILIIHITTRIYYIDCILLEPNFDQPTSYSRKTFTWSGLNFTIVTPIQGVEIEKVVINLCIIWDCAKAKGRFLEYIGITTHHRTTVVVGVIKYNKESRIIDKYFEVDTNVEQLMKTSKENFYRQIIDYARDNISESVPEDFNHPFLIDFVDRVKNPSRDEELNNTDK